MGALNILIHRSLKIPLTIEILNTAGVTLGGLLVTSIYRWYLKTKNNWLQFKRGKLILFVFLSTIIVTIIWLILVVLLFLPVFHHYHLNLNDFLLSSISFSVIILIWVLFYFVFHLVKNYHLSKVEKWQLEAEMQKAKLGLLKSQINPHFMFNALNNIRALILEDKDAARHMLTQFAELLRYSLQYSELKEVSIEEELDMLGQYVELLKIQYEEKLDFKIIIDEGLKDKKIPPMILQLLVENAIKHGLALSESGGEIIVEISAYLNILSLEVKNTGSLKANNKLEDSIGVGINNITERLRLLYGSKASFSIGEDPPFVSVLIKIEQE